MVLKKLPFNPIDFVVSDVVKVAVPDPETESVAETAPFVIDRVFVVAELRIASPPLVTTPGGRLVSWMPVKEFPTKSPLVLMLATTRVLLLSLTFKAVLFPFVFGMILIGNAPFVGEAFIALLIARRRERTTLSACLRRGYRRRLR